jgi:hypothetical protein
MGAKISEAEFMDIILASLPPSYESVMNALTTSLEECGKPLVPSDIIRVLKAQYDKRKSGRQPRKSKFSSDRPRRRAKCSIYALIARSPDMLLRHAGIKVAGKRAKVLDRRRSPSRRKRRARQRQM